MKRKWKSCAAVAACVALLAAFSPAALAQVTPIAMDATAGLPWRESGVISETEYQDDSIHVTVEKDTFNGVRLTMIHVKIADPSQIRTAMSGTSYSEERFIPFKLLYTRANALASVNGDFFKYNNIGYLVRQGEVYRERPDGTRDVLLIDDKGDFHTVASAMPDSINACVAALGEEGRTVVNSFSFGPILALNGEQTPLSSSLFQASVPQQRVAILQLDTLEYVIFHCDGKYDSSKGLTMSSFARAIVLVYPDVKVAYNLDGGGSAHISFLDKQLNANDGGRSICDILYFASAYQP